MSLVIDTRYLFIRSFKKLLRNPFLLLFSLIQPIIFLLLFTQLFNRFSQVPGFPAESYLVFATSGIVLMNAFSSSFQSGISIVDDIKTGYMEKMIVTPVSRAAILLGRVLTDAVRMVLQSLIIVVLALLLGATIATGPLGLLLMLLTIASFGVAWGGISQTMALGTKNSEIVFAVGGFLTFPLVFMSTALTPASFMPSWMQSVSMFNPISYTVDSLRVLMLTGFEWDVVLRGFGVIGTVGIITISSAVYLFRRLVR